MPSESREERRRLKRLQQGAHQQVIAPAIAGRIADSLLGAVQDGNEYQSLVDAQLKDGLNLIDDVARGIKAIEQLRGRPCIIYAGNVIKKDQGGGGVDSSDDLPFREMVGKVPPNQKQISLGALRKLEPIEANFGGIGTAVVSEANRAG